MDLQLYPGAELRLDPAIPEKIRDGDILTINDDGRYALIELPEAVVPQHLEKFFWELQAHEVIPILSHPERNFSFLQNHSMLWRLIEMGALVQITSGSLLGRFGGDIRDFSTRLIKHRMVHVIASDAHSPYGRTPRLMEAFREAEKIVGTAAAEAMVTSNPGQIIEGRSLDLPTPIPLDEGSQRDSLLGRILTGIGWNRR
jgi:protein-tyrosine phosphatase